MWWIPLLAVAAAVSAAVVVVVVSRAAPELESRGVRTLFAPLLGVELGRGDCSAREYAVLGEVGGRGVGAEVGGEGAERGD